MSRSSAPHLARRGARSYLAAAAALVAGGLLAAFWWNERPGPQFHRALASLDARDWERLLYRQLPLVRRPGFEAQHALLAGALLLEAKEIEPSLRELRHARKHPAVNARALLYTGQALYAQRGFREAELCFVEALRLDPQLTDAHRWLAIVYYDIGLMNETVVHLNEVAQLAPEDPRPHRIMAVIHLDRGVAAHAVEDLEESLRRDPWQPDRQEMLLDLASAQLSLKRLDDAQATLAECEESPETLAVRANFAYALGDSESARSKAERALELAPHQRLAVLVLGKLAFGARDYDRAVAMLSQAVEAAPTDYQLRYTLVKALRAAGDTDRAEKELAEVEQLRGLQGDFDELLERAVIEPYNAEIRYKLGLLAVRLRMERMAESWFKAAVALNPQHRLARMELEKHHSGAPDAATMLFRGS